jgi:hypothetical protein
MLELFHAQQRKISTVRVIGGGKKSLTRALKAP